MELGGGDTVHARRLIVTTGLRDELPAVPGVAERYGRDVLHCPFCHGWEVRDERFGVLASSPLSVHQALMVSGWSDDVTLFLHTVAERELSDDDLRRLAAAGVKVVPGEVAALRVEDDRLTGVRLADGTAHDRTVVFVAPKAVPQTGLMERLGAELQETPFGAYPVVDPTGRTSVPGVWTAGNAMGFAEQVVHAASGGYRAASAVVGDLIMSALDAALAGEGTAEHPGRAYAGALGRRGVYARPLRCTMTACCLPGWPRCPGRSRPRRRGPGRPSCSRSCSVRRRRRTCRSSSRTWRDGSRRAGSASAGRC